MFDIFKRKKKPTDDNQKVAEATDNAVVETELNETEANENSSATAVEVDAKNTVERVEGIAEESVGDNIVVEPPALAIEKVGELPSADTVFFQDADAQVDSASTEKKKGFFSRLATGLSKTRSGFSDGVANLLLGKKEIDDDLLEDLETQLVMADVGVEATREIMAKLTERVGRKELTDSDALFEALIKELQDVLAPCQQPLVIDSGNKPYVILMVGINGVGKTTTIGKLAKQFQAKGKSVMLAAGDTFRAAAVEQLQVWGERNDVPVVAQHTGADSASVLYDALEAATARGTDILIADTAGRLHTKDNLMGELEKVVRVMKKIDPEAPHEVMLVLDAGTGQNAINQAVQFQKSVGVTGLTLTKLDGTAKGGVIFALAKQLGLPVRFIGIGEGINDLRPFDANDFTRALFDKDSL
ncbi:MAG: fused signal recognition particle receptor [Oleispira sp.]|jgi:fused signal recognition particle receptor